MVRTSVKRQHLLAQLVTLAAAALPLTAGCGGNSSPTGNTAPGDTVKLDYSSCAPASMPVWLAEQDGNGAWTHVTGTGNVYTFTISAPKAAFAVVTVKSGIYTTTVNYFSHTELVALSGSVCPAPGGSSVSGTVSNRPTAGVMTVSIGSQMTVVSGVGAYQLSNVASGTQTVVAYSQNPAAPGSSGAAAILRSVAVSPGPNTVNVDFATAAALQSATFMVTGGSTGHTFITSMAYLTPTACSVHPLYSMQGAYGSASTTQYGISAALDAASDFHRFTAEDDSGTGNASSNRRITVTFQPFATQSMALPAAVPAGTITPLSGGIGVRRQIALTLPADYASFRFTYADAAGNSTSLTASAQYLGGSAVTLGVPDFSAAGGYLATYGAGSGTLTTSIVASGESGAACTQGATTKVAVRTGTSN